MSVPPTPRDVGTAMRRGLVGRCPNCGRSPMFAGYLSLVDRCAVCGEPVGQYRAADGPAFFTISIVGVLLVPLLGLSYALLDPDPLVLLAVLAGLVTLLTLALLRLVKGAFVGYLWSRHERDPGA